MPRNPKNCKYCGLEGLVWMKTPQGYRMHTPEGVLHSCLKGATPATPDETPIIEPGEPVPSASAELWKIVRPAAIADPAMSGGKTITHEIIIRDTPGDENPEVITGAHPQTAELIRMLLAGVKPLMVGPAGSGKTRAAEMAAEALGVPFYPVSVGPQTSKSDLIGFADAHGRTVRTAGREAFENGGFLFYDEIDAGNAAVLTVINALVENSRVGFPDGTISRTDKPFYVAAAANTYGNGASREYVGRNQLDAATMDRFVPYTWDYDASLENILSPEFPEWVEFVHALRVARERTKIRAVFSTRKIINGASMLRAGFDLQVVKDRVLFGNLSSDDREKLLANMGGM